MARNKNRDRKQSQAERGVRTAQKASMEPQIEQHPQVTPGDVARKGREKRFGHN
ncbi:hypothetical protein ACL02U_06690 [Streptomyces sp. MS06]|uniref:hypothetical protein n=1 Tax=Streptomyces sp. MS06 TaxID=3385974 RepID=UPI0039A31E4E